MEIKKLMIGDWVGWTHDGETRNSRVSSIHKKVIFLDEIVSNFKENEVYPIPITPEILEKNGWWYDIEDMWQHDEVNFCIEKWNGRFQCYDINQIKLYSVHQLQHALRLCGLNDLADNFKV